MSGSSAKSVRRWTSWICRWWAASAFHAARAVSDELVFVMSQSSAAFLSLSVPVMTRPFETE